MATTLGNSDGPVYCEPFAAPTTESSRPCVAHSCQRTLLRLCGELHRLGSLRKSSLTGTSTYYSQLLTNGTVMTSTAKLDDNKVIIVIIIVISIIMNNTCVTSDVLAAAQAVCFRGRHQFDGSSNKFEPPETWRHERGGSRL
jgi:hypothetical protein